MKTNRSFVILASDADDNEVVKSSTEGGASVGRLNASRKKLTKSKSRNLKKGQLGNSNTMKKSKFLTSKASFYQSTNSLIL